MVNWRWSGKATAYVNYTNFVFLSSQQKIFLVHFTCLSVSIFFFSFLFVFLSIAFWYSSGDEKKLFSTWYGWSKVLIDQTKRIFHPFANLNIYFNQQLFIFLLYHVVMNFTWKFIKNRAINFAWNRVKCVCVRSKRWVKWPESRMTNDLLKIHDGVKDVTAQMVIIVDHLSCYGGLQRWHFYHPAKNTHWLDTFLEAVKFLFPSDYLQRGDVIEMTTFYTWMTPPERHFLCLSLGKFISKVYKVFIFLFSHQFYIQIYDFFVRISQENLFRSLLNFGLLNLNVSIGCWRR